MLLFAFRIEVSELETFPCFYLSQLEFQNSISNVDPEFKRLIDPNTMQSVPDDNFINPRAVHKVGAWFDISR